MGPWSADTLQGSEAAEGMALARLSFDLWRPVTRERDEFELDLDVAGL